MSAKLVALADRNANCKSWSCADALRQALADIESGEIKPKKLVVLYLEDDENGNVQAMQYVAGMSRSEHIAFMTLKIHEAIEDWKV